MGASILASGRSGAGTMGTIDAGTAFSEAFNTDPAVRPLLVEVMAISSQGDGTFPTNVTWKLYDNGVEVDDMTVGGPVIEVPADPAEDPTNQLQWTIYVAFYAHDGTFNNLNDLSTNSTWSRSGASYMSLGFVLINDAEADLDPGAVFERDTDSYPGYDWGGVGYQPAVAVDPVAFPSISQFYTLDGDGSVTDYMGGVIGLVAAVTQRITGTGVQGSFTFAASDGVDPNGTDLGGDEVISLADQGLGARLYLFSDADPVATVGGNFTATADVTGDNKSNGAFTEMFLFRALEYTYVEPDKISPDFFSNFTKYHARAKALPHYLDTGWLKGK